MAELIKELLDRFPRSGTVEWIGLRPQKKSELIAVPKVSAIVGKGLEGDHYQGTSGNRDVTLIQAEHLEAVSGLTRQEVQPGMTRRNIVVSGINLLALVDREFRIGDEVVLQATGLCHPCSRMEENLGPGGYNAMRGHGGITARVVKGGTIKVGDLVNG